MGFELTDAIAAAKTIKQLSLVTMSSFFTDVSVRMRSHPPLVSVNFRDNAGSAAASFTLVQQHNCCGILVSTETYVAPDWRGKGVAQEMQMLKEAIAREFGYSALIATVNMTGNPIEAHVLEKCGWRLTYDFINSRTKNKVGMYCKDLK